uniref:Schlafen AlbA-2 domain-containing protein n=1 Tax=mine drainage metagenome TaxID=410659 RepID=E6PGS2_9ZZZZ
MRRYDLLEGDLSTASYDDIVEALQGFRDEGERLEFKSQMPDRSKLVQTACAFANTFGGIIAIGLHDADSADGIRPSSTAVDISNRAQTAALSRIQARTYPSVRCQAFAFNNENGNAILLIRVPRTNIGPHQYLGDDGPPLPVRRDKEIKALSLAEIEALQQRRDLRSPSTSPLGVHTMHYPIQPPIQKRAARHQDLSFFGATVVPREFNSRPRILYEDDEAAIREAISRCVGLEGVGAKTLRDGVLFSTEGNEVEDAKCERDLYVQSDGEISLRMEYNPDHDLFQVARFLGNVVVLSAYVYSRFSISPRFHGTLNLELSRSSMSDFLPRHGSEQINLDLARDDIVSEVANIITLLLRGANRATARDETRNIFRDVWEREFLSKGVVDPRVLWS